MQIVIFLIGIAAQRRHHSQVRTCPRATFFNGVSYHQKAIGRYLPGYIHTTTRFYRTQEGHAEDSIVICHAPR